MTEQLTREQVMNLTPCRKSNWLVHMAVMGNKAWRYRDRVGDKWYTRIKFAPEKPTWPDEDYQEVSYEGLSERNALVADVPNYFGSISDAWKVVRKLSKDYGVEVYEDDGAPSECKLYAPYKGEIERVEAETVPIAIGKCSLLAVMGL